MTMHARIEAFDEGLERRRTERRSLQLPVKGATPNHVKVDALIQDMSLTGVLMKTDTELPADARLALELPSIGRVHATIVWGTGRYYGARFDSPLEASALTSAQLNQALTEPGPVSLVHADQKTSDVFRAGAGRPRSMRMPMMGGFALAVWAAIIAPMFFI